MSEPQRESERGVTIPLPTLTNLSKDDETYLRSMLAFAESGAMFRGRYVEAHVARILGATFPSTAINEWDLKLPGEPEVLIEVKASRSGSRYNLQRFKTDNAMVWVFVRFDSPVGERPSGFSYAVAGPNDRRQLATKFGSSAAVRRVFKQLGEVSEEALLAKVRSCAAGPKRPKI